MQQPNWENLHTPCFNSIEDSTLSNPQESDRHTLSLQVPQEKRLQSNQQNKDWYKMDYGPNYMHTNSKLWVPSNQSSLSGKQRNTVVFTASTTNENTCDNSVSNFNNSIFKHRWRSNNSQAHIGLPSDVNKQGIILTDRPELRNLRFKNNKLKP